MKKRGKKLTALMMSLFMAMSLAACGSSGQEAGTKAPEQQTTKAEAGQTEAPQTGADQTEAGQSGEFTAEEGAEIEVAYWEGSESDKAAWDWALENLQKDHPEIKITAQTYPSSKYRDMLDTRVAGNDWPDVMRYTYQRLGKFKETDTMLDLSPYISKETLDDLVPAYKTACEYDGKLVAMPHHTDVMAVYYNKRMFEESGIKVPQSIDESWSWDEITDIARTLKKDHNLDYAFAGIWEKTSGYRYLPFVYMNGGAILNEDQTEVTMDTPEVLEAIQLYETWRKEDLINNNAFTGETVANQLFVAEQLAFTFSGSWHCSYMKENMPDPENWGVTYMPQKNGKTGSDMGGNGLFAYAGTKYPKAAAIVIEYLTDAEHMKGFCEAGNFIPVRKSLMEEGLTFSEFQNEMNLFLEIAGTVDPKMGADETSVPFQNLNMAFCEAMDPMIVDGSKTAEEVVQTCQETMTEILQDY